MKSARARAVVDSYFLRICCELKKKVTVHRRYLRDLNIDLTYKRWCSTNHSLLYFFLFFSDAFPSAAGCQHPTTSCICNTVFLQADLTWTLVCMLVVQEKNGGKETPGGRWLKLHVTKKGRNVLDCTETTKKKRTTTTTRENQNKNKHFSFSIFTIIICK